MIQTVHPLPKTRRCELLKFPRSSSYYQTKPVPEADQALMKLIDQIHTAKPFLGSRRIVDALDDDHNRKVNRKRVSRLMKLMGIYAIYPRPKTTQANPQHKIYPYLLRNLNIDQANQVWATDITYLPMAKGLIYLTVINGWYSRKVLDSRFPMASIDRLFTRTACPEYGSSNLTRPSDCETFLAT